ncbi:hypothetical protein J6590_100571 [Homalodisca vitripennis]|nr:hypothetical protein J6590_100571 [Homalodisca vitripennis]
MSSAKGSAQSAMLSAALLSNVLFEATSQENLTPISVVTGVYWKEIVLAGVYEASIPLVYKTTWPRVDTAYLSRPKGEGFCKNVLNDPECILLFSWTSVVNKEIGERVAWLNKSLSETADNFNLLFRNATA